ncbi:MAG: tetratricopeptide repeat protein [Polyangiaceae bacterium]|nr:tetratricopeptide repeat protein [Polyangiaceae bacterium]
MRTSPARPQPQRRTLYVLVGAAALACSSGACVRTPPVDARPEPVRSVASPGLEPVQQDAPAQGAPDATAPPPRGLSRGTGTPADRALSQGDEAFEADRFDEAQAAYRRAASLDPRDPSAAVGLARVALARSEVPTRHAASPGDPNLQQIARQLRDALARDHELGLAHLELGRVLLMLGEDAPALVAARRAVELRAQDPEAQSALGVALMATGSQAEALQAFQRAAELDPGNVQRQTNLGTALLMRGRVQEAIRVFRRAASSTPHDARVQTDLGTAYLSAQDVASALPHLRRAVELAPDQATFRSNLGYGLQLEGKLDAAIKEYRVAIELEPGLGSAWINLGTAQALKGQRAEARKAFEKALALDPSDPRAKENLQELDDLPAKDAAAGP